MMTLQLGSLIGDAVLRLIFLVVIGEDCCGVLHVFRAH